MIGILIDLNIKKSNLDIHEILKDLFILFQINVDLYKDEVYFVFQKLGKEYYWEEKKIQDYTNFIKYIDLLIFLFTGKDYFNLFKRKNNKLEKK